MDEETDVSSYWPWWAGAVALAVVMVNFTLTTDRSFGVSSAWERVAHWRKERELDRRRDAEANIDQDMLIEALAAAAPPAPPPLRSASGADFPPADPKPSSPVHRTKTPRTTPIITQVALLVSIFLGGLAAATVTGRFTIRFDMGPTFSQVVTQNPTTMLIVLFVGGVLVGFGTRLAGGCSTGHGFHGFGRLYPASMVATAVFVGTAVVVSLLLGTVL
jgi:hypothetical protein